jgi:membrane protein
LGSGHGIFALHPQFSLAAVLALGFLLWVSLLLSAGFQVLGKYAAPHLQEWAFAPHDHYGIRRRRLVAFAMMFKWLRSARDAHKHSQFMNRWPPETLLFAVRSASGLA